MPASPEMISMRGARLRVSDGRVVAVDEDDHPALVVTRRGTGHTVTCSQPIELLLLELPTPTAATPTGRAFTA